MPSEDLFYWIPYDYDNTFGIDWFEIDWINADPYNFPIIDGEGGGVHGLRPLSKRIMENARFRDLYTHFLEFYLANVYGLELLEASIDRIKSMRTPLAEADTFRTLEYGFTITEFHNSYSVTRSTRHGFPH